MLAPSTLLQNRYEIERLIAEGGMGAVYLARDQRLDSLVALKETLFTDQRMSKAFEREARLLARLRHPALPRVSDHFTEENGQFLIMEYIPGDDLAETLKRRGGPFPGDEVVRWADQLLDALEYLHSQDPSIVHRDIKPQNLKLTERGQIILLDFGLAKGLPLQMTRVTSSGSIFGYTPSYAPMEQIQGIGTDPRSDLYSLAATLYHLVTGTTPVDALTRAAALVDGEGDPLRTASDVNSACAPAIASEIQKALALSRNQRHSSAADMRVAIRHAIDPTNLDQSDKTIVIGTPRRIVIPINKQTESASFGAAEVGVMAEPPDSEGQRDDSVLAKVAEQNASVEELVSAGASALNDGEYEAAIQHWEAAKEREPGVPGLEESIEDAEKKASIDELISAGATAFDNGDYKAAVRHWEEAKKLDPTVPGVDESIDAAQRQIRKEGGRRTRVKRLIAEGTVAFDAKQHDIAIEKWNEALALSPDEPGVQRSIEAARKAIRKAETQETRVKQLLAAGTDAYDKRNYQLAIKNWDQALLLSPNEPGVEESIKLAIKLRTEAASRSLSQPAKENRVDASLRNEREFLDGMESKHLDQREPAFYRILATLMVISVLIIILVVDSSVRLQVTLVLGPVVALLSGVLVYASFKR